MDPQQWTLLVILGMLLAIVYSFRYLIGMTRRIAKMEKNIEKILAKRTGKRKR